jgi:hypothetical protein
MHDMHLVSLHTGKCSDGVSPMVYLHLISLGGWNDVIYLSILWDVLHGFPNLSSTIYVEGELNLIPRTP